VPTSEAGKNSPRSRFGRRQHQQTRQSTRCFLLSYVPKKAKRRSRRLRRKERSSLPFLDKNRVRVIVCLDGPLPYPKATRHQPTRHRLLKLPYGCPADLHLGDKKRTDRTFRTIRRPRSSESSPSSWPHAYQHGGHTPCATNYSKQVFVMKGVVHDTYRASHIWFWQ
jgi:hypothetical protein